MAKTRAQLRTHARMFLDEVSEADWSDAQINTELNYAYMEMYTAVVSTFEDYYRTKQVSNLIAGQGEYPLPNDFFKVRRIEIKYNANDERVKMIRSTFDEITRATDSTTLSLVKPFYDLSGNFLRIQPIPDTAVTNGILMFYIKVLDEMDEDTDTINIPFADRYAKYIVKGACAQLLQKGQQEEKTSAKYEAEFQFGLEKMKEELESRYSDGVKMIQDTSGEMNDFGNTSSVTGIQR